MVSRNLWVKDLNRGKHSTPMIDPRGYLTEDEISRIINKAQTRRDRVLIQTLWMSGRRISEIVGLRKQVKKDGKYVYEPVVGGLKPKDILTDRNAVIWNILKKGKSVQKVKGIPPQLKQLLIGYINSRSIKPDSIIFPITRQRVQQIVKIAGERADIKIKVHPHHFRHSYAIYMVDRIQIKKLQELLDHSDINMTTHYLQYSTRDIEKDVEEAWK